MPGTQSVGIDVGVCWVHGADVWLPQKLADLWTQIGFGHCRYTVDGSKYFRGEKFQMPLQVDHDFDVLRRHGVRIILNLVNLPSWMSGREPAYDGSCYTAWYDADGKAHMKFRDDLPYCVNPPHVSAENVYDAAAFLARRYGPLVSTWACWNEPGNPGWPPSTALSIDESVTRFFDELLIPFTDGVRSIIPDARFSGVEDDSADYERRVLEEENRRGLHLLDELTIHHYSHGRFPDDSYARLRDQFWPAVTPLQAGRSVRYSEISDEGCGPDAFLGWFDEVTSGKNLPVPSAITLLDSRLLVHDYDANVLNLRFDATEFASALGARIAAQQGR